MTREQYKIAIFWFEAATRQKPDISSGGFFTTQFAKSIQALILFSVQPFGLPKNC